MPQFSTPVCYFPGTVLFIDDNRDFLLNFVLQLDEWLAYRVFDSPFDALDIIHKKYSNQDLPVQRCLTSMSINKPLNDYYAMYRELYNPERFADISVVVVDYAMPGMNGLDVCRSLDATRIKKILLTGQADEDLAQEALRCGLIDRYIHKNDPDVADLITAAIEQLQWQYAQETSIDIIQALNITYPSSLDDTQCMNALQQYRHDHHIAEFYLLDTAGHFLLVDVDAGIHFLQINQQNDTYVCCDCSPLFAIDTNNLVSYHAYLQDIDVEELLLA